jgi:nucleoside-diphosphate-sugar epimerase
VKTEWPITAHDAREPNQKEAVSLDLDSGLASKILGWSPLYSQEEAILRTINWWDKVLKEEIPPDSQTKSEIDEYLSDLIT